MWVIRADVAGNVGGFVSLGSSPDGTVVQSARNMNEDLLVADIATTPPAIARKENVAE